MSFWNQLVNNMVVNPYRVLRGQAPYSQYESNLRQSYLGAPDGVVTGNLDGSNRRGGQPAPAPAPGIQPPASESVSYGAGGGGYGSGGGGSRSYAPPMIRTSIQDKIDMLNNLYNAITNDLITMTQGKRSKLEGEYGRQRGDLTSQYEKSQAILPASFAARNVRNSSYYDDAVTDAADTYNRNLEAINRDREEKLASIGQQYAAQEAQLNAARSGLGGVNPNFYGTQADLDTTRAGFDKQAQDLNVQRAGLGTDTGYLGKLNAISAAPNTGTVDLQAQLKKITESAIPGFAKDTIAKGLIKQAAGGQQKELEDYYASIQAGKNNVPYSA